MDNFILPGLSEVQGYSDEPPVESRHSKPSGTIVARTAQFHLQDSTTTITTARTNPSSSRVVSCTAYTDRNRRSRKLRGAPDSSNDEGYDTATLADSEIYGTPQLATATKYTKAETLTVTYRGDSDPEVLVRERIAIRPKKISKEERNQQHVRERGQEAQAAQAAKERNQRRSQHRDNRLDVALNSQTDAASTSAIDPNLKPDENGDITISIGNGAEITISGRATARRGRVSYYGDSFSGGVVLVRRGSTSYYGAGGRNTVRRQEEEESHVDRLRQRFTSPREEEVEERDRH
ncbi:hypothetical protein B0T14DRAFT_140161 [Immersiella caudata]|uniref:Uncharacterized protein n=1 Tax=Immersiella caudata TaxID=314043 RepID=A0AA39X5F2_9PEZI|nr:hypothetical protein B0T14DRAFT_140161 [Immersiella caudata]